MNTGKPIVIHDFVKTVSNEILVLGHKFIQLEHLYQYPLSSRRLGICVASNFNRQLEVWDWKAIQTKAIKIQMRFRNRTQVCKHAIISLLHHEEC